MGRHSIGRHRIERDEHVSKGWVEAGSGTKPAGFIQRLLAFLIDLFALLLFDLIIVGLAIIAELLRVIVILGRGQLVLAVSILLLDCLYFILLWHAGGTLGQSALGLKVIGKDGRRLTLARSVVRFILFLASFLSLGIGFLPVALRRQKRGLHDLAAGSLVVKGDRSMKISIKIISQAAELVFSSEDETVELDLSSEPFTKARRDKIGGSALIQSAEEESDPGKSGSTYKERRARAGFSLKSLFRRKSTDQGIPDGRHSIGKVKVFTRDGASSKGGSAGAGGDLPVPKAGPVPGHVVRPASYSEEYSPYRAVSPKESADHERGTS
ncbi:MAG: RDD family protein [Actinobacteria bacterium]|nr:RDD family protein [Actinomycetota bacterium]